MLFQFLLTKFFKSEKAYLLSNFFQQQTSVMNSPPTLRKFLRLQLKWSSPVSLLRTFSPHQLRLWFLQPQFKEQCFMTQLQWHKNPKRKLHVTTLLTAQVYSDSVLIFATFDTSSIKRNTIEPRIISGVKIQVLQITTGDPTERCTTNKGN